MTNGYAKVFSTILASSVWAEDDRTRLIWITMLVMSDSEGVVRGSAAGLAHFARVPVEDCIRAIEKFKLPDAGTSTKTNDGRRVEEVDGGWRILNHGKYQQMMSLEERKAYWRRKKAESRAKDKEANGGLTLRQIIRRERKVKEEVGVE